jgi:hypothetical protein
LHTDLDKWCFWLLGVLKMPGLGNMSVCPELGAVVLGSQGT